MRGLRRFRAVRSAKGCTAPLRLPAQGFVGSHPSTAPVSRQNEILPPFEPQAFVPYPPSLGSCGAHAGAWTARHASFGGPLNLAQGLTLRGIHCTAGSRVGVPQEGGATAGEELVRTELRHEGRVALVTLSRPKALNALCDAMQGHFREALQRLHAPEHDAVGAIVVTGQGKAFAAGADIAEMRGHSFVSAQREQILAGWEHVMAAARKPIIAAVNGYALGGGCELAMMCDVVLVGEGAVFGQPEVKLGVIPGLGGTQRLVRAVGKSRAMEMVLSGEAFLSAQEAVQLGLASRVVPGGPEALVEEALGLANRISQLSGPAVQAAKECVNAAHETVLSAGLARERAAFYATFALEDQKEGMAAFLEKRTPLFKNK